MVFKKEKREQIHQKYNRHCAYCGDEIKYGEMQVDHIIPQLNFESNVKTQRMYPKIWLTQVPKHLLHLTESDVNHIDNLNPSCRKCNNFKSTFHLELFRTELQDQINRARRYSTNYRFALKFNQIVETPKPIVFYFEKINNQKGAAS